MTGDFINQGPLWAITMAMWVLLFFVLMLIMYCFFLRFVSNRSKEKQFKLYAGWEKMIFKYLEGDQTTQEVMALVPRAHYAYFQHFLKNYLLALKGTDFEKLSALVTHTDLFPCLTNQLVHGDEQTRSETAFFLGLLRAHQAKECLIQGLMDGDEGVYFNCALSLAKIGAIDAIGSILEQFRIRKKPSRDLLLSILFEFGIAACQPLLEHLKKETDVFSISLIVDALGHYRYYPAGEEILCILDATPGYDIRINCVRAIGKIEYLDAMPSLRECMRDADWRVRSLAIWALGRIGDDSVEEEFVAHLGDDSWWVRYRAAEALFSLSKKGKETLMAITKHSKNEKASSVARVLLTDREVGV